MIMQVIIYKNSFYVYICDFSESLNMILYNLFYKFPILRPKISILTSKFFNVLSCNIYQHATPRI